MQVFRRGDRGPAVAEIRAKLERLGRLEPLAGRRRAEPRQTRPSRSTQSSTMRPTGRFAASSRTAGSGSTAPSDRRPTARSTKRTGGSATGCCPTPSAGRSSATTSPSCSNGCSTWASIPVAATGSSARATEAALRGLPAQRRPSGRRAGSAPARCGRSSSCAAPSPAGRPPSGAKRSGCGAAVGALAGRVDRARPGPRRRRPRRRGHGLVEAEIVLDLAARIEGRLGALGVTTYLTRSADICPSDRDRAMFANEMAAEIFVSLHLDAVAEPERQRQRLLLLRREPARARDPLGRRRAARRPDRPRGRDPHRPGRRPHPPEVLGAAAADPDARDPTRRGLRHQPGRRGAVRDAGVSGCARRSGGRRRPAALPAGPPRHPHRAVPDGGAKHLVDHGVDASRRGAGYTGRSAVSGVIEPSSRSSATSTSSRHDAAGLQLQPQPRDGAGAAAPS